MAKRLTHEDIATLSQQFQELQADMDSLGFPDNFLENMEQFAKLSDESAAKLVVQHQAIQASAKAVEYHTAALEKLNAGSKERAEHEDAIAAIQAESELRQQLLTENIEEFSKTLDKNKDALEKSAKAQIAYAEAMDRLKKGDIQGAKQAFANARKELDKFIKSGRAGELAFNGLANSFLGLSGPMQKLQGFLTAGPKHWKSFLKGAFSMKTVKDITWKALDVSIQYALELDNITSNFRKATGAGDEFNQTIKNVERSGRIAGVTFDEVAEGVKILKNTWTDFSYVNEFTRNEIARTVTILAEMGFGMQTQADIIQTATKSMGLGLTASKDLLLDIASTARSLDIDIEKMGQEFVKNKDILVRYGTRAGKVFEDLAVKAKASGVEVSTLLGLMDRFKTFDEAGQAVGRLNAILGGPYLNSIDMLNASLEDPIKGIEMLKDSFDQAGVSADQLSGAELLAFSDALGMSAEETARLMSKSNAELEIERMNMEEAAEAAREMQSITDELKNSFKQLIIDSEPFITNVLQPFVRATGRIMGKLGELNARFAESGGALYTLGAAFVFAATAGAALAMLVPGMQPLAFLALATVAALIAGSIGVGVTAYGMSLEDKGAKKKQNKKSAASGGFLVGGIVPQPHMGQSAPLATIRMNEGNFQEEIILPIKGYQGGGTVGVPPGSRIVPRKDLDEQNKQRENTNNKLDTVASLLEALVTQGKDKTVKVSNIEDALSGLNPF